MARDKSLIVQDLDIMQGNPTIKGTRITASSIYAVFMAGDGVDTIVEWYPQLTKEQVEEAIRFCIDKTRKTRR